MVIILISNIALRISDHLFKEIFISFQSERSYETVVSTYMYLPQPHDQIHFSFHNIQILHKIVREKWGLCSHIQKEIGLKINVNDLRYC